MTRIYGKESKLLYYTGKKQDHCVYVNLEDESCFIIFNLFLFMSFEFIV